MPKCYKCSPAKSKKGGSGDNRRRGSPCGTVRLRYVSKRKAFYCKSGRHWVPAVSGGVSDEYKKKRAVEKTAEFVSFRKK